MHKGDEMIEPKDGEWWMCEFDNGKSALLRKCEGWRQNDDVIYEFKGVKPLYKMVKAEEPKPRTKLVYEEVDTDSECLFSLHDEWDTLSLYVLRGVEYQIIVEAKVFANEYANGTIYRKVEKEIDWKDELINQMGCGLVKANKDVNGYIVIGGVTFPDEVMIEMCHLVAGLTDKD